MVYWSCPSFTSSNIISACTGQTNFQRNILGGYGLFGNKYVYKQFINVPTHYQVEVDVNDYLVDSWDSEYFYVYIENTQIISREYEYLDNSVDYCGSSSYADSIENYDSGTTSHTSSSLTIKFTCNLDQNRDDESYGFKDFNVYLTNMFRYYKYFLHIMSCFGNIKFRKMSMQRQVLHVSYSIHSLRKMSY